MAISIFSGFLRKKSLVFIITLIVAAGYVLFISKEDRFMAETKLIQLPKPLIKGNISLEEAIFRRRSQRSFKQKDLTLQQISQLLWAAQGITLEKESYNLRTAPSAGALYPMEIYLLTKNGLFRYLPNGHRLEPLSEQDLRGDLVVSSLGQVAINQAPVNIVICAVYSRLASKYGQRGIRYAHIEVGHIAQNIHLQSVALGLSSVPIGAFNDEEVKKILSLPANHEPLYIIPVGYSNALDQN
ncbi:MAG: SagB/ThcOx family dehydrogenase [Candidatus Omnitrophica bacterium]|nr:SagB/ThcOx family dehydrogenase [Candidatus Omnitrophota bacterium]